MLCTKWNEKPMSNGITGLCESCLNESAKVFDKIKYNDPEESKITGALRQNDNKVLNIKPIAPAKTRATKTGIVQFSLSGIAIEVFETIQEASEKVTGSRKKTSGLRQAANGQINTAYGYQWKWLEEVNND